MAPTSHQGRARRLAAVAAVASSILLAAGCARGRAAGSTTLRWYVFNEPSGAFAQAARRCTEASHGRYRLVTAALPSSADQQREQLVRRLAARDPDIDVIGMDVIWTAELAEAGWILPWPDPLAGAATRGAIGATVASGTYNGRLWAAPFTTNAQLLWYRKDRVAEPPATWAEMIAAAEQLGEVGTVQVQGNRYEGLTVWFVSLLASARGQVIRGVGADADPALGPPAVRALEVMRRLATSPAADPSLSTSQEDSARLAFESGDSSFMVNYTFVWPSAQENAPEVARNMGWARYPRVLRDEPSHVTVGGINLGVAAFSRHPRLAFEAAACLRLPENQVTAARKGGLPPTDEALYDDPRVQHAFPFADVLRAALRDATQRPQTPAYNDVSLAIQRTIHPPRAVDPRHDVDDLRAKVGRALRSGGLL